MATQGTPYEGRDNVIVPGVYTGLDLRLYTNSADSLDASTVLGDLVAPTGTGYTTITLSGVWSSTNGVVTYDDGTPDNPIWTNSGSTSWSSAVVGVAITDGTYLLHFKDLDAGPTTVNAGDSIEVDISSLVS